MRRRFRNPAPVPSGVGSGPAAVSHSDLSPPVSREQEEAAARIWSAPEVVIDLDEFMTPATDPLANAPKRRGRPKGSKNKRRS